MHSLKLKLYFANSNTLGEIEITIFHCFYRQHCIECELNNLLIKLFYETLLDCRALV